MDCKLCGGKSVGITYKGAIRDGQFGNYTGHEVDIYKCNDCGVMWHKNLENNYSDYYKSEKYRVKVEGTSDIEHFYMEHDRESLDKLKITGTEIYRNKVVADIGCAGGAFLDYVSTVARQVVAIEPSEIYQNAMAKRGYECFSYAGEAKEKYRGKIDVIVSFDVIEHVENPIQFVNDAYELLNDGGRAFIGTPTDAPVMRQLMGEEYSSFVFTTQHPWVFSRKSLALMAEKCGIEQASFRYYQRYGLGNCLNWLINRKPGKQVGFDFVSKGMDELWKNELERQELADYIVLEFEK